MNTRILASLVVIGVVGAFATGSTFALFSDTETSEDNTFTAGAIDLGIDVDGGPFDGSVIYGQGNESLAVPTFFSYSPDSETGPDIKPGDVHERTLSLHVNDNPAYVCAMVGNVNDSENGQNEPEMEVDGTPNTGELGALSRLHIWADGVEGDTNAGDNIYNQDETDGDVSVVGVNRSELDGTNGRSLPSGFTVWPIADSTTNIYNPNQEGGPLAAETVHYVGVEYSLPLDVGNEAQTDSYSADIAFYAVQSRSNEGFSCVEQFPEEPQNIFGSDEPVEPVVVETAN